MANISTYPIGTPAQGDLIPGTQKYTNASGKTENLTRNFTVANIAAFANSYSLGYTVYSAQLTAGAGAAPTVTILQNTTGLTFAWTRTGAGVFVGTVAGTPLVQNKFWAQIGAKVPELPGIVWLSTNTVRINNVNSSNAVAVDGIQEAYLEIRIYS
tara:strand:- start:359 stop:826 length:468 start_codon:yes stop_codon:yes gene_type:complete